MIIATVEVDGGSGPLATVVRSTTTSLKFVRSLVGSLTVEVDPQENPRWRSMHGLTRSAFDFRVGLTQENGL